MICKLAGGERFVKTVCRGKSTGDSRFRGARGCSHLDGSKVTQHSRSVSFLLLRSNEATRDALLSTESIEVRHSVGMDFLLCCFVHEIFSVISSKTH